MSNPFQANEVIGEAVLGDRRLLVRMTAAFFRKLQILVRETSSGDPGDLTVLQGQVGASSARSDADVLLQAGAVRSDAAVQQQGRSSTDSYVLQRAT
jgi:hypothetical protein